MSEPLDRDLLFKRMRSKPENKVCAAVGGPDAGLSFSGAGARLMPSGFPWRRFASIAPPRIPHGLQCHMESSSASHVRASTAAWACTSALSGEPSLAWMLWPSAARAMPAHWHHADPPLPHQVHHAGYLDRGAAAVDGMRRQPPRAPVFQAAWLG